MVTSWFGFLDTTSHEDLTWCYYIKQSVTSIYKSGFKVRMSHSTSSTKPSPVLEL